MTSLISPVCTSPDKPPLLTTLYPNLVKLLSTKIPHQYSSSVVSPEVWTLLHHAKSFSVRQQPKHFPKNCHKCPVCVKQPNTYSVYVSYSIDTTIISDNKAEEDFQEIEIFRIDELSDDWNRCCCSPHHPFKLEVRQYIPLPGDHNSNPSDLIDYSHYLSNQIQTNLLRSNGIDRIVYINKYYNSQPVLFTIIRDDGQRDGLHVYMGSVVDNNKTDIGRSFPSDRNLLIGSVIQPLYGGWYGHTLHLRDSMSEDIDEPFGKIEGPCLFGGWTEFCCQFKFYGSSFNSPRFTGDLAKIIKKKNAMTNGHYAEFQSNSSIFTIDFMDNTTLTAAQKVTVLSSQLLSDYMIFDGNTEKYKDDGGAYHCYFSYCSCIGYLFPCALSIPHP
eukprot:gene8361-11313_t